MTESRPFPPPTRAEKLAWCGFDFANSSFTTVIVTALYAPFVFDPIVVGEPALAERLWLWAQAVSQTLVLLTAPLLGAFADRRALKKRALTWTWILCAAATAGLAAAGRGDVAAAWLCFVAANVGFAAGENLIAAFLPELASHGEIGRLSGLGWAVGYFGGLASLAVAYAVSDIPAMIPLVTAGFFAVAGLPTIALLRERAVPRPGTGLWRDAFADVRATFRRRREFPDLFRLLLSLLFQQAGVAVVIGFAGLYAKNEFGMNERDTATFFVALQLTAAAGAWIFGRVQDRLGSRVALFCALGMWIVAVAGAVAATNRAVFWGAASLCGAAMGASQACGRAAVGRFAPLGRSGEWFGFWGLATKAAAVGGLCVTALLLEQLPRRAAMSSTLVFFVAGALLLATVNETRGVAAARTGAAE